MVKRKRTNNDLQNTTQKTKVWATRTPLNPGLISGAPDRLAVHAPLLTYMVKCWLLQKNEDEQNLFQYGPMRGDPDFLQELATFLSTEYGDQVDR